MQKTQPQIIATQEKFQEVKTNTQTVAHLAKTLEENVSSDISLLVNNLIFGAAAINASDIHIEPEEEKVKIRARIDGALFDVCYIKNDLYKALLSRLKIISGMKINITAKPQDGRFSFLAGQEEIESRTSTLPSEYGETMVLRLLNPKNLISLNELGVEARQLNVLKKEIQQPNGMIIVTGPTGSGKTTTLYGVLKQIHQPEIKIITIEDPIEYRLEGISQSQVEPERGYDFATGLSTIVRQDPDVILVGEIRDSQTAKIALQAALTGHLVLTTLHTNDAAGTIARLQALGESAKDISPAINLIIAQRLVRKICPQCAEQRTITKKELDFCAKELSGTARARRVRPNMKVLEPKGCPACNGIGFKGRVGIYEFLVCDDAMKIFIANGPQVIELKNEAIKKGMLTLRQDGILKFLDGITTIEEVKKATGE